MEPVKREAGFMKRQSGIDLVRITGMFFVLGLHQFLYNGFYSEPQMGWAVWAADVFRWLFFCCNGLFMMLTGYLKCGKRGFRECCRGLVPLMIGYGLTCLVVYPAMSLSGEKLSLLGWVTKFLNFGNYAWYLEMYLGLALLSPVLNLGLGQLKDRELCLFALIMVGITSLHSITGLEFVPDYWSALYPVTYYVLGAAIRRMQPKVNSWMGIGMALLVCAGMAFVSLISTNQAFSKGFTQGYGDFWTMLTAVCVFLGLYRVQVGEKTGRILAWLAGGVFEGFLLSKAFDLWTYPLVRRWHQPELYPLVFLSVTVPSFLCCLLLGKLFHRAAERIANRISWYREKINM